MKLIALTPFLYRGVHAHAPEVEAFRRNVIEGWRKRIKSILAASDIGPDRWRQFPTQMERLRALILDRLSARASHMIAYQNAWRLITGETWGT